MTEPLPTSTESRVAVLRRGYGNRATPAHKWQEALVRLMAGDTPDGKVHLGGLGQYLRRTDPAFSPQAYGHSGLLDMLRSYAALQLQQEPGGHWCVRLAAAA